MESTERTKISIQVKVKAPLELVWKCWTTPEDITQWNQASADWHCPLAVNDLRPGGAFCYRMEARDGSFGFDFSGLYQKVKINEQIDYLLDDGRKVEISFADKTGFTEISQTFEAEDQNPVQLQRDGWQAIMNSFKKHTELKNQQ